MTHKESFDWKLEIVSRSPKFRITTDVRRACTVAQFFVGDYVFAIGCSTITEEDQEAREVEALTKLRSVMEANGYGKADGLPKESASG